MANDERGKSKEIGPLLTEIGQKMAEILDRDPEGALLFAEAGDNWSGGAIFIEEGDAVHWIKPSHEIFALVQDVWAIDSVGKEEAEGWNYMEYEVRNGRFHASFTYRSDARIASTHEDWEDAAVAKRFGDKPVIYPPMPGTEIVYPTGTNRHHRPYSTYGDHHPHVPCRARDRAGVRPASAAAAGQG